MSKSKNVLTINRKRHGIFWWLSIGWWERPIATIFWFVLSSLLGFKKLKIKYYRWKYKNIKKRNNN